MQRWSSLSTAQQGALLARPAQANSAQLSETVSAIIQNVATQGDDALRQYSAQFDKTPITHFALSAAQWEQGLAALTPELKRAIDIAYGNILRFHQAQKPSDYALNTTAGVNCSMHYAPLSAVGLYIPGGSAPLPSTVLMLGTPAQVAGCERKVLCSPPNANGSLHPAILYAAQLCGIDEIYLVGGAQAIAAMALGTNTIAKVDKIFGPGNSFVTEAKQQVSQMPGGAAIDMPAGPSEVLVLADSEANPAFVAADLLSQAEHGEDSQAILVSDSKTLIEQTQLEVEAQLARLSRQEIARKAMQNARYILANDMAQAIAISNQYAPEHLIVQTQAPRQWLPSLKYAGSIFLGAWSPESAGDYASGTNHVLPTYGYSRTYSSLGLLDFYRRYTVQELSSEGLQNIGQAIMDLADAEGLDAHKQAVALRLESLSLEKSSAIDNPTLSKAVASKASASIEGNIDGDIKSGIEANGFAQNLSADHVKTLVPYESARRLFSGGQYWLNANESPYANEYQVQDDYFNRYPDCQPPALLQAYADYAGVNAENVIVSRGADEGIELLIRAFCEPGNEGDPSSDQSTSLQQDTILICPPTYGMYAISANTFNVGVQKAPLNDDFSLDLSALKAASEQAQPPKLVFVCSPNNPTGTRIAQAQLEQVLAMFSGKSLVVVDEAYIEFDIASSWASRITEYDNLVVLRTLSKAFALAGIRCGFTLASEAIIKVLMKVIAPYPISAPVAQIAQQALSQTGLAQMQQQVSQLQAYQTQLLARCQQFPGWELVGDSCANFLLFRIPEKQALMDFLVANGMLIRDQSKQAALQNCLRISIGNEQENQTLIQLIEQFYKETQS